MGRQSSGSRKVVIRLEYSPQRIIPIPARFVDVQLAELSNICRPATSAQPFDRLWYATVLACRIRMCLHIVLNHVPTN